MSATAVCQAPVTAGLKLGQLLTRAHEDVQANGKADCPVCGGTLLSTLVDAECATCGTCLS